MHPVGKLHLVFSELPLKSGPRSTCRHGGG